MSVTNQPATGFAAPSRQTMIRVTVVVVGLIAGAILAVSLAGGEAAPAAEAPAVDLPIEGRSVRSLEAEIERLTGLADRYQPSYLSPRHQVEADRWNGLAGMYVTEPLTRGQEAAAQRWAGIALRYGSDSTAAPSTGLGAVDEFEEKLWHRMNGHDPFAAQNTLPDF